jgi:EAL domain-containing protein (putative c-di-GMP-specific phosphodiesterase class I)
MTNELVALGIRISMDDFGTGYSSLAIIQQLPIHIIKIDRSFIQSISQDQPDRTIVPSIVTMSHSLGKMVIAEGVEEEWHDVQSKFGNGLLIRLHQPITPDQKENISYGLGLL